MTPWRRGRVVALAALAARRVVTMANPFRLRHRVQAALEARGITPVASVTTNASVNAAALVRAGLGVAVLEPVTAYGLGLEGVVVRALDVAIPFLWGVVTAAGLPPAPAAAALITQMQAVAGMLPGFRLCEAES